MNVYKLVLTISSFLMLYGCQEDNSDATLSQDIVDNIEGKWNWTSADVSLVFSDGRTVKDKTSYNKGEQILEFKITKSSTDLINGTVKTAGSISSASGIWQYDIGGSDQILKIEFTSQSPSIKLYRKIDRLDATHLDISAQNALLVQQYEANSIQSLLASGSVHETYVK